MTTDDQWLSGLGLSPTTQSPSNNGKIYMAAASPWFYTHYGANTYDKNVSAVSFFKRRERRWEVEKKNWSLID